MMKVCVFWSDVVEICYDTQSSMFCFLPCLVLYYGICCVLWYVMY
jgi:hypothetical protein